MSKYSLKKIFYSKNRLLSEMAIITQSNFIERIMKAIDSNPKIAGLSSTGLDELKKKSADSDLNKLEDSIAKEIIRCIYKTNILDLTGKENKKARKKAEVLIIKQLRKYNNIDLTPIEFKNCLPLYDKIADYIANTADVDLSDCIRVADMYMKNIYPNSLEDEKRKIEKGEFSFHTVVTRTGYYKKYLREYERRVGKEDIYLVHESSDWKVVFPCTPKSFKNFAIRNSKSKNPSIPDLSWCTLNPSTWFNYMESQYLFIAIYKKPNKDDRLSLVSLKVDFDGTINIEASCCRYNEHLNDSTLGSYISGEMIQDVKEASDQLALLGFGESEKEGTVQQKRDNLARRVREITKIRNAPAIKNIMTKFCLSWAQDTFNGGKILVDNNQGFTTAELTDLLVEWLSELFFNNWPEATPWDAGCELPGMENFLDPSKLGVKIIDKFKEKILDPRSHPQHLITLLSLNYESLENFSNEEIKKAVKIVCETNNEHNYHRVLSLLLRSKHFQNIIELKKINNLEKISSPIAKEIIEIILNSKGNINFTKIKKYKLFSLLNHPEVNRIMINQPAVLVDGKEQTYQGERGARALSKEAPFMLGNFYAANPERFAEISGESNPSEKIKKTLFNNSIRSILNSNLKNFPRFAGIDNEEFRYFVDNLFLDFDLFNKYFDLYEKKTLSAFFQFASKEMTSGKGKNLVNLKNQEFAMIFEKITVSIKDDFAALTWALEISQLYKNYITDRVKDVLSFLVIQDLENFAYRLFTYDDSNKKGLLAFEIIKKLDVGNKNKLFYKYMKIINSRRRNISFLRDSAFIRGNNDGQLKDFVVYTLNSNDDFDFKIDSAFLIQELINDKTTRDDIGEDILRKCLTSRSYYKTRTALQNLSKERATSKNVTQMFVQYIDNLGKLMPGSDVYQVFDYLAKLFSESNIPFPKESLSKIILVREKPLRGSYKKDYDSIMDNFIAVPREVSGKDLAVIRNTLIKIFRKNNNKNYYNDPAMKKFIIEKISEMPRVARGHMQLVFPDLASQLRARTPEEEAEQAARNETLLRQYVKMLLS